MAKPVLVTKRRRPEVVAIDRSAPVAVARVVATVTPTPPAPSLSDSERYSQISLCAYFRAERRGFEPGHMWDDWLAAEEEVAARNARGVPNERG
jgi:hypothetical protein